MREARYTEREARYTEREVRYIIMANYLDILTDDIVERIFEIVGEYYEEEINKCNMKLKKVKRKVCKLKILSKYEISTKRVKYCLNHYLYDRIPYENICVISKFSELYCSYEDDYYNEDNEREYMKFLSSKVFTSKTVKNPIYLDLLLLVDSVIDNKNIYITDSRDKYLADFFVIDNDRVKKEYDIDVKNNITYLEYNAVSLDKY